MRLVLEVAAKALVGGCVVVLLAVLAQTLSPKRFAGVFAAAPSVALPSLLITLAFTGPSDARRSCLGMAAGALGFIGYCLLAPVLLAHLGTLRGALLALLGWAGITLLALPTTGSSAALAGSLAIGRRAHRTPRGRWPKVGMNPSKVREGTPRELAIRFVFGAAISAWAAVLSRITNPVFAGTFLAFPAILLASLTLIADEEGQSAARDDARGATAGAIGLLAFAVLGAHLFDHVPSAAALGAATGGWIFAGIGSYAVAWAVGLGADEPGTPRDSS